MASEPRTFKLQSPHMTGDDVGAFQRDLQGRFQAWKIGVIVTDDNDYGNATKEAAQRVCIGLGILHEEAMKGGVTPELRTKIRHPEKRTPQEITRSESAGAKEFRAKLRERLKGSNKTLTGIDISNNQNKADFEQVKGAGHSFAFHKVSEGLGSPDHTFAGRWKAMRHAGLVRGAYHFARPQKGRDPKAEAREFLKLVSQAGGFQDGDLYPVLDIEAFGKAGRLTAAQTHAWARGFVQEIREAGHRTIIYTGNFWRDDIGNPSSADANFGCPLWLAAYVEDPKPFVPKAWATQSFAIHQHTQRGSCAGIPGHVDLNKLPGGDAALNRLRI